MLQMAVNSVRVPKGIGPGYAGQLCRELEVLGAKALLTLDSEGALTTGATLVADVAVLHRSSAAAARFREQAYDTLAAGLPLSVSVCGAGEGADAQAALSAVFVPLRLAMEDAGAVSGDVAIVVDAAQASPETVYALRRELLGDGAVFMLANSAVMQAGRSPQECVRYEQFWSQLWRARTQGAVSAVLAPVVVPQCALLSAERAVCVQPSTYAQVPAGSAWLPLRMNVAQFADRKGALRWNAVEHALCRSIEIGDALHDLVRWPSAELRHDAWLNRRLALELTGFGDLVERRALDPRCFSTLRELCALVNRLQEILHGRSRAIAQSAGQLPAFKASDPSRKFPPGRVRDGWRSRWLDAVDAAAVRHRNVLALSPWSIFPQHRPADYRYSDLLPVLGFANACTFPPSPCLARWNISKFKYFHKRAWAVLQQRGVTHQIAERP